MVILPSLHTAASSTGAAACGVSVAPWSCSRSFISLEIFILSGFGSTHTFLGHVMYLRCRNPGKVDVWTQQGICVSAENPPAALCKCERQTSLDSTRIGHV